VARVVRKYQTKSGEDRESVSHLLRRSFRQEGKIRHETLGNVSALPAAALEALRASLAGETLVVAGSGFDLTRSLPHGHVAAVSVMAKTLGLRDLLGPPCKERDIANALILARVVHPRPKLATTKWWGDTTLAGDLGLEGVGTDEVYAAMDWLGERQGSIEAQLAQRHLGAATNPSHLAYFDLSSSWVEGSKNELAARGYSRDKKRGMAQIEYGLLTDKDGRPVAVEVFSGNTADPTAFISIVETIRTRFGLDRLTMVGDRGMITSARISVLREVGDLGWLTCLRAPQIAALAKDDGPLQLSLFDQSDLAEFSHPDYPGERLIACRNPLLAEERKRKRSELLAATEEALAPIISAVREGRLTGADQIGLKVGKVLNKYKMAKHFEVAIGENALSLSRREEAITAEAALDGIYVLRTTIKETDLDAPGVVDAYKALSHVERDFRHLKIDDIDLRPIHHRLEARVRSHVFICMLASYLVWHLREALAPLTFTDEVPPMRANPVAPALRSAGARAKAASKVNGDGEEVRGFRELLEHLGTLTRNTMRTTTETTSTFELLATPTPTQRRAFELLGAPVPLKLL
jgi:Transposase DDE domain